MVEVLLYTASDGKKATQRCPCGYLTDSRGRCSCPSTKVQAYLAKLSGPLLDRIDLHVEVPAVPFELLAQRGQDESSAPIKARIVEARARQATRLKPLGIFCNARLRHRDLRPVCPLTEAAASLLKSAMQELHLSARSYDKILKSSRTISDLAGSEEISPDHVAEAIQYRSLDRQWWG